LEALLARDYGISHLTLQVDHCTDQAPAAEAHPHERDQADGAYARRDDHAHERQGPQKPREAAPATQQAEEDHAPGLPHCEDSHGPAYRPTHNPQ
jgi:hypothetical protein